MTLQTAINAAYRTSYDKKSGQVTARIDDRKSTDTYRGFCEISLAVDPDDSLTLTIRNPPLNDSVRHVLEAHDATCEGQTTPFYSLRFSADCDAAYSIRALAEAIKSVTRRGESYADPNWKWMVPRTVKSLTKLARILAKACLTNRVTAG